MSAKEFFAQMKIALKSAEKSYEEVIKGIPQEKLEEYENLVWLSFRLPMVDYEHTEDDKDQNIVLKIERL